MKRKIKVLKKGNELKVNLRKTKVRVGSLKGGMLESKAGPRAKSSKGDIVSSVLCTKFGTLVHGRCAEMKILSSALAQGFTMKDVWRQ